MLASTFICIILNKMFHIEVAEVKLCRHQVQLLVI